MNKIIIQDEITITQKAFDAVMKRYSEMPSNFSMGINCRVWTKAELIKEIATLSETGKRILMMDYRFNQWKETDEYKRMEKEALNTNKTNNGK